MIIGLAYRGIPGSPGWAIGDSLYRAFTRLGIDVRRVMKYYKHRHAEIDDLKGCEFVLRLEMVDEDVWYELGDVPQIYWEFDTEIHQPYTEKLLDYLRPWKLVMGNKVMAKKYKAHYLPLGVDLDLYYPDFSVQKDGVALVGSDFKQRVEHARACGYDVLPGRYREQYMLALQQLEVAVHYYSSGGDNLMVCRVLEAVACGAPLLAQKQKAIEEHFICGTHYLDFSNEDECRKGINYLLHNKAEAQTMAERAYMEVVRNHTWMSRAKAILEIARK